MPLSYWRWDQAYFSPLPGLWLKDKELHCVPPHQMGLLGKRRSSILSTLTAFQGQIWGLTRFLLPWNHRKPSSFSELAIHTKAADLKSPLNGYIFPPSHAYGKYTGHCKTHLPVLQSHSSFLRENNCSGGILVNAPSIYLPQNMSPYKKF